MSTETNTTAGIQQYYAELLIPQYSTKPKASAQIALFAGQGILPQTSVQNIDFNIAPTSGSFVLSYEDVDSTSINWNDSTATIQSKIQAVDGLSQVTVAGTISSTTLTVTFTGVTPPALSLVVVSNSLTASSVPVQIFITETDQVLPLAVQNAYNLIVGTDIAQGVQLDVLGKYCGVTRSGQGFTTFITLDDTDFYTFIQMAIAQNSSGSSLSDIQNLMFRFFGTNVLVYDNKDMSMTFIISTAIGSTDLIELLVSEGRLPVPMAVLASVFVVPTANLYAWGRPDVPIPSVGHGFTFPDNYDATGHWLTPQDVFSA